MKVTISYCHKNLDFAERIEEDLQSQGIEVWIDKGGIKRNKPKVWLQQLDDALYDADFVVGIITNDYINSTGAKEGFATITKDWNDDYVRFIPLFFEDIKEIRSVIIPALQGFLFYQDYDAELIKLFKYLKDKQGESPSETLSKIESPDYKNPFYRVRAESFGEDYALIARAFAKPEATLYEKVQGNTSVYLFGGRGVGKTMLLKSLLPEVICSQQKITSFAEAKSKGIKFFGIYFRLKCGCLINHNHGPMIQLAFNRLGINFDYDLFKKLFDQINHLEYGKAIKEPIISDALAIMLYITLNEMNYKIIKTIVENLIKYSNMSLLKISSGEEKNISVAISQKLFLEQEPYISFVDILKAIDVELNKIEDYVQNRTLINGDDKPNWVKTGTDFLGNFIGILKNNIGDLRETNIYLLFDEFENLMPVQQVIINEWVKTAHNYVVKVSSKYEGMYTKETFENSQPLQFNQDCPDVKLDYDISYDKVLSSYQNLLLDICFKLLEIAGYKCKDIKVLLSESNTPELPQEVIDQEIKLIRTSNGLKYDVKMLPKYRTKLSEAAVFRLLSKKRKVEGRTTRQKRYCGFETFTYLSSGIIRIFLNLAGAAIYKAEQMGLPVKNGQNIPVDCQTWAADIVSKGWLDKVKTVQNIGELGEKTYQLLTDLGYIFRERLLKHPTEPETLTISLTDPLNLRLPENREAEEIFSKGMKESVFYGRPLSVIPKDPTSPKTQEYILNRVYSPALRISYRARWPRTCNFTVSQIQELLNEKIRSNFLKILLKKQCKFQEGSIFGEWEISDE